MRFSIYACLVIVFIALHACGVGSDTNDTAISTDPKNIDRGRGSFSQYCSACHNFQQDGIGPQLSTVTQEASVEWIRSFIKDPKKAIDAGDERAVMLFEKFKSVMPPFSYYSDDQIDNIIAYLNSQRDTTGRVAVDPRALPNPIPDPIPLSTVVVGLSLVARIPPSDTARPYTRINKLDFERTSHDLFVVDLRGTLYKLVDGKPVVYLDLAGQEPNFIDHPGLGTGFGSFAFHPDFSSNGLLYTTHTEPPGSAPADFAYGDSIRVTLQWVLTEWKTARPAAVSFSGTHRELLRIDMFSGIHGVQEVTFNPLSKRGDEDYALLYIGVGDGGSAENGHPVICNNPHSVWGKVIRIDPTGRNSTNGKYGIPGGNPFAESKLKQGEVFAYGFRNPHRISWTHAGDMLVSNIGQHRVEDLEMVRAGNDYGWPEREGTFYIDASVGVNEVLPLPPDDSTYHFTYPVAQFDHDEGNAISGGYEYTGNAVPQLKGKYVFGDIVRGRLFYIEMKDVELGKQAPVHEWQVSIDGKVSALPDICGSDRVDLRFGKDADGTLYIFTKADGKVYRLVNPAPM